MASAFEKKTSFRTLESCSKSLAMVSIDSRKDVIEVLKGGPPHMQRY